MTDDKRDMRDPTEIGLCLARARAQSVRKDYTASQLYDRFVIAFEFRNYDHAKWVKEVYAMPNNPPQNVNGNGSKA